MAYKSLLTIVGDPDLAEAPLNKAVELTRAGDGHLDVLCIGVDRTQTGYYYAGAHALVHQETMEAAHTEAIATEEAMVARLKNEGINFTAEKAVAQLAGLGRLVSLRARFADLVLLPKPYGEGRGHELETILEAAMFDGHAAVMVVPEDSQGSASPKRIVVAWNESDEAMAAIRAALPVLKAAEFVSIAVVDPPQHGANRSDPGGAVSQLLARHGIKAEISVLAKTMPRISDVLLRHTKDVNAGLVVMGAYGHSRFREAILGGATRDMLEGSDLPVLMAH